MRELIYRTVFGILYVAAVIAAIWFGKYSFGALFLLFSVLSVREFVTLAGYDREKNRFMLPNVMLASALLFLIAWIYAFDPVQSVGMYGAAYFFFLLAMAAYVLRFYPMSPLSYWGTMLTSQFLVALPFACLNLLMVKHWHYPMMLFIILWANDTFAYVVGSMTAKRANGNHKMSPMISPKKSWEGLAGGLAGALLCGVVFYELQWIASWQNALIITGVVAISGVLGDLMESMFKRSVGVKDSGTFLPGHGGAMDRFDSMLMAAPMMLIFLYLLHV